MKKLRHFLLMNDWIWSILLAFGAYQLINYGPPKIFNTMMAYFSINWMQPLIATAGVMAGLFTIARLGLFFNLKKLHEYGWGKQAEDGKYHLPSYTDLKSLKPWQKLFFLSFWLLLFIVIALIVFLRFIPLAGPQ